LRSLDVVWFGLLLVALAFAAYVKVTELQWSTPPLDPSASRLLRASLRSTGNVGPEPSGSDHVLTHIGTGRGSVPRGWPVVALWAPLGASALVVCARLRLDPANSTPSGFGVGAATTRAGRLNTWVGLATGMGVLGVFLSAHLGVWGPTQEPTMGAFVPSLTGW